MNGYIGPLPRVLYMSYTETARKYWRRAHTTLQYRRDNRNDRFLCALRARTHHEWGDFGSYIYSLFFIGRDFDRFIARTIYVLRVRGLVHELCWI